MKNKINNQSGFVLLEEIVKLIIFGIIGAAVLKFTESQIVFWIFIILGILFILLIILGLANEISEEKKYYASKIEKVKWNKTTSEFIGIDTGKKYSQKEAQEKNKLWNNLPSKEKKKIKREKESLKKHQIAQNKRIKRWEKDQKKREKKEKNLEKKKNKKRK